MALTCKVRILDEVSVMLVGLHGDHVEHFYNKYAVPAPNYFFNPLFKLGRWDGKVRYFQKPGKTYLYLLDEIIPALYKLGYTVTLDDLRPPAPPIPANVSEDTFAHILHQDTGEPIKLRDYQYTNANKLMEHGNGLIIASTGAGKTLFCAALVNAYGETGIKTMTIVPSQDLIRNTKQDYIHCGLDTGEYSGQEKDLDHLHVVSTWQALRNNPSVIQQFGLVLVDEVHGAKGKILQELLTNHAAHIMYRFGVTGTMPKDPSDALSIRVALGPIRGTVLASDLMDQGILASLQIDIVQLEENLQPQYAEFCKENAILGGKPPTYTQFRDSYFPDFTSEKSHLHHNTNRLEWIAAFLMAKRDSKRGNVLCFVDEIAFGRKLAAQIPGAIFVNGRDVKKSTDRQVVYDMFKTCDDLIVIATVHIAGTGLNIRRVFNLVLIDVGKSFIRVIQAIGRGLRTAHDKTSVITTDICSDLKYSKKHLATRIAYYNEAKYPYKKHKLDYVKHMDMTK